VRELPEHLVRSRTGVVGLSETDGFATVERHHWCLSEVSRRGAFANYAAAVE